MRRALPDGLQLDDDAARGDLHQPQPGLSTDAYWALGRARETVERLVRDAQRVVGAYDAERLVGFCRVVSDGVSFAYLADVYVWPAYRGRGVGLELVREAVDNGL